MTVQNQNIESTYLNNSVYLGDDEEENSIYLTSLLRDLINALNNKELATYDIVETYTCQDWFQGQYFDDRRTTFRIVIQFPILTAIGITSIPHNLGNISNFTFTKILGTAKNAAGTLHVPLPQGGPDNVMITIDANNVNIICATATYNNFSAQIILEYLKN